MGQSQNRNNLGSEKSPYLLQHRENPVHWQPWGSAAFERSMREAKPIFLSIGYSTCYWCHVMEKDSFEFDEVAQILNEYFVSIKVDREERPDVDQIYMDAVVALTGHGGWPMSVFLTPDRRPFFGGTFFYRTQFIALLEKVAEIWRSDRDSVESSAAHIAEYLSSDLNSGSPRDLPPDVLSRAAAAFSKNFDESFGGFGTAPKFPPASAISLLLRISKRLGNKEALEMAERTLEMMARGGIYDQVGGGFHRYSTDTKWLVPHFEKMLYDNALLARTYLEAFQVTGRSEFGAVARETLEYLLRDMSDSGGGFYSAEDAGEVGAEGEFYVWRHDELKRELSLEEFEFAERNLGVTKTGNFEEHFIILNLPEPVSFGAKNDPLFRAITRRLLASRSRRTRPHRDEKILTAWNALAISAFAKGYQVLGEKHLLAAAENCARFLREELFVNGRLRRHYRSGVSPIEGFVEDYAFLVQALLDLYESGFDEKWLTWALELQITEDEIFWDKSRGGYYFSHPDQLIARKKETNDDATPSSNSISALNLLRLFHLTGEMRFRKQADEIFSFVGPQASRYPAGYSTLLIAHAFRIGPTKAVVIAGERDDAAPFHREFLPDKVLAFAPKRSGEGATAGIMHGKEMLDGKVTYYICENQSCRAPTHDLDEALRLAR